MAQVWTLNATYTDRNYGVMFRHPRVWQATTQSGYLASALDQSDAAKPIAGFGYSEDHLLQVMKTVQIAPRGN
jgi:hypothetical protein